MEPTIHLGEIFFVTSWPSLRGGPRVGDVVVFRFPKDRSVSYAKRVAALGGSTIEIREGKVIVDGKTLDEPYVETSRVTKAYARTMPPLHVPQGSLFMLGDNRDNSYDSRAYGPVPIADLIGWALK